MSEGLTRIGVSMRVVNAAGYDEPRDAISHEWVTLLAALGVTPVLIPNRLPNVPTFLDTMRIQGLLLTGGNDIGGHSYAGDGPGLSDASPERDATEHAMLDYAVHERIPVLGTCRGIQMLNVHFGGMLLSTAQTARDHVATTHHVTVTVPTVARALGGADLRVNSYHRHAISDATVAPDLRVLARAALDDSVEGLYHPALPIIGVMWHPERTCGSAAPDPTIVRTVFLDNPNFFKELRP